MPVTIKCPDCGHSKQSEDGATETCPQCDGTMAPPPKKKYQAKSTSLEEEDRARKKARLRDDDDDDEPKKPAKKPMSLDDEDDEDEKPKKKAKKVEKGEGGFTLDGSAAESLDISPGFDDRRLMEQVEEELSRGEVLHWVGRMCPEIAQKKAQTILFVGLGIAGAGVLFCALLFAVAPWFAGLIPIVFVIVGAMIAAIGPGATRKMAERGWYAVTDQRAIVFAASPFGSGGQATSYEPHELRRMRVKAARSPKGAGDLVFKTKITEQRTDYVDRKTGRTVRSETSRSEMHYGFLGIENVREVETLIHKVLLGADGDADRDDD